MEPFEVIDISGDAGIRAYGSNVEELFSNAAFGMYSLITDLKGVEERREISIETESLSLEGLLVSWLNELIFHLDTYGFVGRRITISQFEKGVHRIKAIVSGEDFDPERHERKLLIKAATYHRMKIEQENGIWSTNIIFDI